MKTSWRARNRTKQDKYPEKFSSAKSPCEFMESVENWIEEHYGVENIPLAYVIRETVTVPKVQDDFPIGQPTFEQELIRQASHDGEIWSANNSKV